MSVNLSRLGTTSARGVFRIEHLSDNKEVCIILCEKRSRMIYVTQEYACALECQVLPIGLVVGEGSVCLTAEHFIILSVPHTGLVVPAVRLRAFSSVEEPLVEGDYYRFVSDGEVLLEVGSRVGTKLELQDSFVYINSRALLAYSANLSFEDRAIKGTGSVYVAF